MHYQMTLYMDMTEVETKKMIIIRTTVPPIVRTAFRTRKTLLEVPRGPIRLRKVPQKNRVYSIATAVSRIRISAKRVKRRIFAPRRGSVARSVVRAELRIETPMKEMAESTRLTLGGALCVN